MYPLLPMSIRASGLPFFPRLSPIFALLVVFILLQKPTSSAAFTHTRHGFQPLRIVQATSRPILSTQLKLPPQSRRNSKFFARTMSTASSTTADLPPDETLDSILAVAIEASKLAGEIILGNAGGAEVMERKANSRDLLTLIDPLCEKTIRETVLATFPTHDFLGEEDVPPGKEASAAAIDAKLSNATNPYLWIVDPIDGTSNFVHGMPLCMPSVAVAYKGEVIVGVIHDPHRKETFTAVKGKGAFMNGKPIKVGEQSTIGDAIVAMGSPPAVESMEMSLKGIKVLMPKVRTIRMLGSAALMLAWVANGRLTCYWEYDLSSWDISAGALIIKEAGGKFTDLEGKDFDLRVRKICASNGKIHDDVLETLKEAGVV